MKIFDSLFSKITSILWCRTNGWWCRCASGSSYATEWPPETPLESKWPLRFGNDLHGQKLGIFLLCLQKENGKLLVKKIHVFFPLSIYIAILIFKSNGNSNPSWNLIFSKRPSPELFCIFFAFSRTIIRHAYFSSSFRFNKSLATGLYNTLRITFAKKYDQIIEWWKMKSLKSHYRTAVAMKHTFFLAFVISFEREFIESKIKFA